MSAVKIAFGIVAVLVVLVAAALAGISALTIATITTSSEASETMEQPFTTSVVLDAATTEIVGTEAVEVYSTAYDPSGEMEYLYIQSENMDASFAELSEIQQRMYDVADDYDEVEYDQLQEQVDNARTSAKENRNEDDPYDRDSGDGEADYQFSILFLFMNK